MKIGIITFWQTRDNYGQMLQCFALQKYLKSCGHDPFLIRYAHSEYIPSYSDRIIFFLANILHGSWTSPCLKRKKLPPYTKTDHRRAFDTFKQKYLRSSEELYYSLAELKKNAPIADCYIVGSDQVWSKSLTSDDGKVFFLMFGPKSVNRIAYAASFGNVEISGNAVYKLARRLSLFDSISVREKKGVEYCQKAGYDATHVVDPTLLLSGFDYVKLFGLKCKKTRQLFIYSLNISSSGEIRWHELKEYATFQDLSIIVTPSSGYIVGSNLFEECVIYQYNTITEWLNNIIQSEVVVTTSFHGIVFSLLMHTPFVYIPLKGRFSSGNNRVFDLLDSLKLSYRILCNDNTYKCIIESSINWDKVDAELNILRKKSVTFLNESINKTK